MLEGNKPLSVCEKEMRIAEELDAERDCAIRVENLIRKVLNEPMRTTYKGKKNDEKYLK